MMYYRRKVILALLQAFGGILSRTDLQKLLFLFVQGQEKPSYDFLPYRFGCYSAQSVQDLKTLTKYEVLEEKEIGWFLRSKKNFTKELKDEDRDSLGVFVNRYEKLRGNELIKYVYTRFPFYAIKSEIANKILNKEELAIVHSLQIQMEEPLLATIGYEGKSVESYVTELIKQDIHILCDVRKNPLSMKYGFSKNQLKGILEGVGIGYLHLPGLGIESDKRKSLNSTEDYNKLFLNYESTTLKNGKKDLETLVKLYSEKKRIALTCFEADFQCCHRSRTAKAVQVLLGGEVELVHL